MSENNNLRAEYRSIVSAMGKKEFTLLKMQEYGFWPNDLPTPYEKQKNESNEDYDKRKLLTKDLQKIINDITKLYKDKEEINNKLKELKKEYDSTWDYEKIRNDIASKIMKESIERRKKRKKEIEELKLKKTEEWKKAKSEKILYIGKGYSNILNQIEVDEEKLQKLNLPIIKTDKELAEFLKIDYKELRFLVYHRDVVKKDHYHRYEIDKKRGGKRKIASPKPILKFVQRKILSDILEKIHVSEYTHGFIKEKSVVTSAKKHYMNPNIVINIDIKDFFTSITFRRVLGMFKSFGYSGYIASLFSMIVTYCERIEIDIKGEKRFVKISDRILPQGSPASPMITNIICKKMDERLKGLSDKFGFRYTRYADDMSFSKLNPDKKSEGKFYGIINKILNEEGFSINKSKTRFLRKNNCQMITGIVINNNEPVINKKWIKNFRAAIYNAKKLKNEKELSENLKNEIMGMCNWAKSVNSIKYEKMIIEANKVLFD